MRKVVTKPKILKAARLMPIKEQMLFAKLVKDLAEKGPVLPHWPNYKKLANTNTYHCHLSYHWAACWIETLKGIELEVTYVGSRENAPY